MYSEMLSGAFKDIKTQTDVGCLNQKLKLLPLNELG